MPLGIELKKAPFAVPFLLCQYQLVRLITIEICICYAATLKALQRYSSG